MAPSLLLHSPLLPSTIASSRLSSSPPGIAHSGRIHSGSSCCSNQLHTCWRVSQLWRHRVPGARFTSHHQHWRKPSAVAQPQHSISQPTRSRRSSHGTVLEQGHTLLVADTSTGSKSQMTTVAAPPPFPPPQSQVGSPVLWIGVGIGISVFFSFAARRIQNYAMQQIFKSMMQQTTPGSNQFGGMPVMPPGFPPFPSSPPSPSPEVSSITIDAIASAVSPPIEAKERVEKKKEARKPAFTDINMDSLNEEMPSLLKMPPAQAPEENPLQATSEPELMDGAGFRSQNSNGGPYSTTGEGKDQSFISIEMLERMLDDPKVQKMVFPYLPEEFRDPVTFKRMIQLPPVRQQLQEALNNMGGEEGLDMLKYMNSDVVKQQFEQVGLTPEEVVGKILANPDIAASLQNSKVVEAIMDCSQNPLNITKYQNDPEVMSALFKIAELFPGATSSPY